MPDLSRRSLLAGVPAAAVAATPVAVVAGVAVATRGDPVFAAIEAHRVAWSTHDLVIEQTDGVAERENREMTVAENKRYRDAADAEEAAWEALMDQPCETLEAVRSKAAYLQNCPRSKGIAWEDQHVDALLASFAGGSHG